MINIFVSSSRSSSCPHHIHTLIGPFALIECVHTREFLLLRVTLMKQEPINKPKHVRPVMAVRGTTSCPLKFLILKRNAVVLFLHLLCRVWSLESRVSIAIDRVTDGRCLESSLDSSAKSVRHTSMSPTEAIDCFKKSATRPE